MKKLVILSLLTVLCFIGMSFDTVEEIEVRQDYCNLVLLSTGCDPNGQNCVNLYKLEVTWCNPGCTTQTTYPYAPVGVQVPTPCGD